MLFLFGIILFVFIIGLIVSKGNIRNVFLAGLRFIFIAFVAIAAVVWIFYQRETTNTSKTMVSSYDHSAYVAAQHTKKVDGERKKVEAVKVGTAFLAIIKTMFHDEICFRAWYESNSLIVEIYKKY